MAGNDFLAKIGQSIMRTVIGRVIGFLVVLAVAGAFAGFKMLTHPNASNDNGVAVTTAAPVRPAAPANANAAPAANAQPNAPANAANVANANNNNLNNKANAKGNPANANAVAANAANNTVHAASVNGSGAPITQPVSQVSSAPAPGVHLDDHLTYQYNALGRRDPFQSLVDGQFVGADVGGDAPPDPGGIKVVGIVWGPTDQFALVEDVRGNSFVLRKGDKVQNGYVEGLKRDGVIVNITAEGQTQSVVIPLVRKGDQNVR